MRCSSLDAAALVVAVVATLAGCASRGASRGRDGARERAAGLPGPPGGVRSGSRTGGVGGGAAPPARRAVRDRSRSRTRRGRVRLRGAGPVRALRLRPDAVDGPGLGDPGRDPARRGALLCREGGGFAAVDSSFGEFWVPAQYYRQDRHPLMRLIPQQRMAGFIAWARRSCAG